MAFNNYGYPMYPQYYPTQPTVPQMQQASQTSGPIWVQGEAGAKSYLVAPGTTVALWDSEAQVIYLKSADPSGMPQMKVLDYTIRGGQPLNQNLEYAKREDLERLAQRVAEIQKSLKGADE